MRKMFIYKKKYLCSCVPGRLCLLGHRPLKLNRQTRIFSENRKKNENCQINFWKDRNNLGIICCLRWPGPPLISHGLPSSPRMKGHFQSNPITSASLLLLHFIHFSQLGDLECLGIIIIRRRIKNRPRKEENSLLMNKWNTTKLLVLFSWWKPIRVKLSHPLSPLKKY